MSRQLALDIELDVAATFAGFFVEGSAEAVTAVRQLSEGMNSGPLWICGVPGVGKSHLLQAACRAKSERGGRAMFVPLARHEDLDPRILEGIDAIDLLAIDDVDVVAGNAAWEAALFAAVNQALLNESPLLLAASALPGDVGFRLPDLRSRAGAHVVYQLPQLSDEGLAELIAMRAEGRGLNFDSSAIQYLLRRVPRDMHVLEDWLARLDKASLAAQRRVTVALVRSVLADDSAPA